MNFECAMNSLSSLIWFVVWVGLVFVEEDNVNSKRLVSSISFSVSITYSVSSPYYNY